MKDDDNETNGEKSISEITEVKDLKASRNALLDETKQLQAQLEEYEKK